jgi:MFS transporter, DHA1 family, multidrug resistance protein
MRMAAVPPRANVPRPPSALKFYLVLASLTTLGPFSLDMYLPGLPALAMDFRASESASQLTLTACLFGLGLGQLVAGPVSDALGRRTPLIAGLLVYLVASVLCAVAPTIVSLVAFRLLQGMAGGTAAVIAIAVVRDRFEGRAAARFYSLLILVTLISPLLAPVFGGELLLFTSWRGVFIVLTGVGAVLLGIAAIGLPETLPSSRRLRGGFLMSVRAMQQLAADRVFISYALPAAFGGGAIFSYLAGSSFVLERVYGATPFVYGLMFTLNGVALGTASQMNRWLLGRMSAERLFIIGLWAMVSGGVALALAASLRLPGIVAVVAPVMLIIASNGFVGPNSLALALTPHPNAAGTGSALIGSMRFALGGMMAPVVGIFGARTALPLALTMCVLCVAAGMSYVVLRQPMQRRGDQLAGDR